MPLSYSQLFLSESNGLPIAVTATSSPGQIIHTVQVTATQGIEQIVIGAKSRSTASMPLTIEFGSTEAKDRYSVLILATQGEVSPVPSLRLRATTSIIRAYSSGTATGAISVYGFVKTAS